MAQEDLHFPSCTRVSLDRCISRLIRFYFSSRAFLTSSSRIDVGYFYQNQFAALRDLNALICDKALPPLSLNLLV